MLMSFDRVNADLQSVYSNWLFVLYLLLY